MLDLAILLIELQNGACALELIPKWPKPLINLDVLKKKLISDDSMQYHSYCSEYSGFEEALKIF